MVYTMYYHSATLVSIITTQYISKYASALFPLGVLRGPTGTRVEEAKYFRKHKLAVSRPYDPYKSGGMDWKYNYQSGRGAGMFEG